MNELAGAAHREKVRQYWILSSIWRGREMPSLMTSRRVKTMGEIINFLSELADLNLGQNLDTHVCGLLDDVIQNKRCRKSKPVDNVIKLRQVKVIHEDGSEEKILLQA